MHQPAEDPSDQLTITLRRTPVWGTTAHDAILRCPHGTTTYALFGTPEQLVQVAHSFGPSHRRRLRCRCQPAPPAS